MFHSGKGSPIVRSTVAIQPRRAFTLVELLIVIAIIGLLVAILTPAIHLARQRARNLQCQSNLKQCAIGLLAHASDARGSYCTGAWNWKEDGAVTEYGWVADLVNLEVPVGEMLCPSNQAQMTETYHQLLTLNASSFTTCESGLGAAQTTLPDGTPYLNPCRVIQPMAVAPGSTARVQTIVEKIYEKGYNTNYTPSWFLCRTGLRLDSNLNLNPRTAGCGSRDSRAKNCCVGPLRDRSLASVVSSSVPILGDGGISTLQLPVAIGRVAQGDFLVHGMTGGPKRRIDGSDVLAPSGSTTTYASGASGSGPRWTELAKNSVQDYTQFGVPHGGQLNVAMADGSVKAMYDDNEDGLLNTGFVKADGTPVLPFQDATTEAAMTVEQKIEHLYSLDDKSARL